MTRKVPLRPKSRAGIGAAVLEIRLIACRAECTGSASGSTIGRVLAGAGTVGRGRQEAAIVGIAEQELAGLDGVDGVGLAHPALACP